MAENSTLVHNPEAEMVDASTAEDDGSVFFVKLAFKGGTYEVPVETGAPISSIFDFVLEVPEMYDFPRENCKLICKGKVYRPDDIVRSEGDQKLAQGSKLMLMATSNADASFVRNNKADPLVKGFKEEERDERNRRKRAKAASISAWGTKQDQQYRFNKIKAEFKYSSPSPYDAEKLLQKLATDPGIIDIMKTKRFEVGILTEMSPAEAEERMKNKGQPNMDLLGYNQNAGEMIVLKLRTDNTKGFRPYHDLINTLIHEMTHNVWGPHDHNFWKLFGELKAQYMKFHRFWSHGGQATGDSNANGQFQGFVGDDEDGEATGNFGQVLGGASSSVEPPRTEAERRERAILAAEARKVTPTSGFNFLNTGGKMVIVCPCGQTHDMGECPMGFAPKDDDDDSDDEDDEKEATPNRENPPRPPEEASGVPMETNSVPDVVMAEPVANDVQDSAGIASDEPLIQTDSTQVHMMDVDVAAPASQELPQEVPAEAAACPAEFESRPAPDSTNVGPLGGLSAEDLEALGLGGAASWLQSFSERLQALTGRVAQPTAKQAIELLLKLVRNIVNCPHEAKFRRVKADNPKIRSDLLSAGPEIEKLISLLGFDDATENGGRVFVLRDATFDCARLQMGQELLEQHLNAVMSH